MAYHIPSDIDVLNGWWDFHSRIYERYGETPSTNGFYLFFLSLHGYNECAMKATDDDLDRAMLLFRIQKLESS